uniref:nucleoside deaminase n=1 Tax=Candidatus Enterococcus willemsii TaxID=1857215 RepID=UPI00403F5F0B
MISEKDLYYLNRCVELAQKALEEGDQPFGSVLVNQKGKILFEDHNHIGSGDSTRHPEFEISRWAAANLTPSERKKVTVYTSGEHCPMCAAAHGWVGLGRIVYASSSAQLGEWLEEINVPTSPVKRIPIHDIIENPIVDGPVLELADKIKSLHLKAHQK